MSYSFVTTLEKPGALLSGNLINGMWSINSIIAWYHGS